MIKLIYFCFACLSCATHAADTPPPSASAKKIIQEAKKSAIPTNIKDFLKARKGYKACLLPKSLANEIKLPYTKVYKFEDRRVIRLVFIKGEKILGFYYEIALQEGQSKSDITYVLEALFPDDTYSVAEQSDTSDFERDGTKPSLFPNPKEHKGKILTYLISNTKILNQLKSEQIKPLLKKLIP